jgi:hypothetical protein
LKFIDAQIKFLEIWKFWQLLIQLSEKHLACNGKWKPGYASTHSQRKRKMLPVNCNNISPVLPFFQAMYACSIPDCKNKLTYRHVAIRTAGVGESTCKSHVVFMQNIFKTKHAINRKIVCITILRLCFHRKTKIIYIQNTGNNYWKIHYCMHAWISKFHLCYQNMNV